MAAAGNLKAQAGWPALREFAVAVVRDAGPAGVGAALLVAIAAVLDGAGLLLVAPLLGTITGGGQDWVQRQVARLLADAGIVGPAPRLWALLALFVLVATFRAVAGSRRDVALAALQTGFAQAERNRLIEALARASWPRLIELRHAETTALLSIEAQRVASACTYLVQGTVQLVFLAVHMLIALLLAPALAAAALLLLVTGSLALSAGTERIRGLGEGFVKANQAMMESAGALLGGLKSAVAQNAQHAFVTEFVETQAVLRGHQLAFAERQARTRMSCSIVSALLAAAMIAIGFGVLRVPAAILLTLVLIIARMGPPAQQLHQNAQSLMFTLPAFQALRRARRSLATESPQRSATPARRPNGAIELSGVTFVHPSGGGVRDVNLVVPPSAFIGITGPSGAGKTTLADLVCGLLEPQAGSIRIGGRKLTGALRAAWGECIAYVGQEGFLFDDTVRRNLLWGAKATGDADIAAALRFVAADSLVGRLERGLETMIGERGATLSGGERQRLLLARALLRRPRLLILDEAASAMDLQSETALLERLKALEPRPAILMISHRPESLTHCDRVARVEHGVLHVER